MDIKRAKEIVSVLAEGVDPTTGEVFPSDHICNNAEVVRAFYALLQQGEVEKKKKNYENASKRWTKEEEEHLRELFKEGVKVSELQKRFLRSRGSIESRLAKLGLIEKKFPFWGR